ncbi:hypothetical protein Tco_1173137 [Tanacetum coccineum]
MAIRGVSVNGKWVVDADVVKQVFLQHFASRFSLDDRAQIHYNNEVVFLTTLSFDQNLLLEEEVTNLEIKKAVWDYSSNKSPGPDGYTFEFIKKFWDVLGDDVCKILANRLSMVMDKLISKEQSAFIRDRQILDGPMILSELTKLASEQFSSGPGLYSMTPATSCTGLVSKPVSQQPCIPPNRDDWDRLFQPMFDEYFNPPTITVSSSFEESPKTPTFHDDPLNESPQDSTSQGSSSNVIQIHTPFEHLGRWTKDHPIANMIGDPSRSVSTRKQLETDAM